MPNRARYTFHSPSAALCRRKVNFENPNFNIGLPVFTIHGNHDDPAGSDNLSAVDMLSTCSLVNYFGKTVRYRQPRRGDETRRHRQAAGQAQSRCQSIARAPLPD